MVWSRWLRISAILLLVLSCTALSLGPIGAADGDWEHLPGTMTILYASDDEVTTYVAPPPQAFLRAQAATVQIDYQNFPPEAQAAFEYAASIWGSLIVATVPIRVKATWEPFTTSRLAQAGPSSFYRMDASPWYPVALAEQRTGADMNAGQPDIIAQFNSAIDWYFGSGQTPAGQTNFTMVALHELGHGLGFTASMGISAGQGGWGAQGKPFIFDQNIIAENSTSLLDKNLYPVPSTTLAAALQSDALYFNGPNALQANDGSAPRLYAPQPFAPGSSINHLDENTYPPGTLNSLMTPFGSKGETNYNPGPIALGILADLGWPLTTVALPLPAPSPAASPAPPSAASPPDKPRCFAETGQCVSGRFLAMWETTGGLAINGYPLTSERRERLEDGKDYLVQWFERVRMEYHPEHAAPYDLQLSQFGRFIHPADPPVAPLPGLTYFPQTGHNVPSDFSNYWHANGGLTQFGFPLSEVFRELLEDGREYEVQYFERARFERHPRNAPASAIQIGQFGRLLLAAQTQSGSSARPRAPLPPSSNSSVRNFAVQQPEVDPKARNSGGSGR